MSMVIHGKDLRYRDTDEVARLISEFEACTLARERWTHEHSLRCVDLTST